MIVAKAALLLWPLAALAFFRACKPAAAFVLTVFLGYLFLPERGGWDPPVLPTFDKVNIPALAALVMMFSLGRDDNRAGWIPKSPAILIFLALALFGAVSTALTNTDPIGGSFPRPGHRLYDGLSFALATLMMFLPFLLARRLIRDEGSLSRLLSILVVAMSGYALLALYEVRMSPQLSNMIYGFFPHSWFQHIRGSGFRPIVFLGHGLILSLLLGMATLAALGLARHRGGAWWFAVVWLLTTLILSKSLGALVITLLLMPAVWLANARSQALVAAVLAGLVLIYPAVRATQIMPLDQIISWAASVDPERANSAAIRFRSEDQLLERGLERSLLGWGGYGRGLVFDEFGNTEIRNDGFWIITFSQRGWIGYIGQMGLLTWGILALAFRRQVSPLAGFTALVMAANLVDLIPNASSTPLAWMLAGALAGLAERGAKHNSDVEQVDAGPGQGRISRTARQHGPLPDAVARSGPDPRKSLPYARDFGTSKASRRARPGHARTHGIGRDT